MERKRLAGDLYDDGDQADDEDSDGYRIEGYDSDTSGDWVNAESDADIEIGHSDKRLRLFLSLSSRYIIGYPTVARSFGVPLGACYLRGPDSPAIVTRSIHHIRDKSEGSLSIRLPRGKPSRAI